MAITKSQQLEAYRRLFKAGKIPGAFHAGIGQEAAIVSACIALRDDDAMTGSLR